MATFVQNNGAGADTADTTITVALTGVGSGNLIILATKHEGAATTITVSDGTDSLTGLTKINHANGDLSSQFFYLLSSSSGNKTYTVTYGASRAYRRVHVWEYSYTGTASFDVEAGSSGTSTAANSGNMTTTGTDEVCMGFYGEYSTTAFTSPLINAVAADGSRINSPAGTYVASWYRLVTSTFTGAASGTLGLSKAWVCLATAFKVTAPGGRTTKNTRSWPLGVEVGMGWRMPA